MCADGKIKATPTWREKEAHVSIWFRKGKNPFIERQKRVNEEQKKIRELSYYRYTHTFLSPACQHVPQNERRKKHQLKLQPNTIIYCELMPKKGKQVCEKKSFFATARGLFEARERINCWAHNWIERHTLDWSKRIIWDAYIGLSMSPPCRLLLLLLYCGISM